ncbi:MAG: DUF4173 domain-containing protein, partial [Bacteroidia bacterium]|nr:DUF4173 domain-containing protein [Bacteroidia bacterium]
IVWKGTTLAVIANVVSLILLAASSINPTSSVILNLFFSAYSIGGSFVFIILRIVDPYFREKKETVEEEVKKGNGFTWKKFLTFFLPFVLLIIFFVIFRAANPLFKKFTNDINLDFISLPWIGFTLSGFLLVCGFFYQYRIKVIDNWEGNKPKRLAFFENQKVLKFINEKNAALFLFGMLNLMLLFINGVDLNYLYLGAGLPEGITHSDFVHNGVGMLILSIIIAVSLLLFFFRGNINFDETAKILKIMVYIWIAQNIFMIVSTILRNNIYVAEYNLTYKRIGVYVYLTLTIVGLLTTFYKISDKRNNWFLFRANSLAGILLLVFCSAIDFDLLITQFNITKAKDISSLDKTYLISLSETNLPELFAIRNQPGFNSNSSHHYSKFYKLVDTENNLYGDNNKVLDQKLLAFFESSKGYGWRSWNMRKQRIMDELGALNQSGKLTALDLSFARIKDLSALAPLTKIKSLNLASTYYLNLKDLQNFPELEKLDLQNNSITNFDSLPQLKSLKEIKLSGNNLYKLSSFEKFPTLEKIEYMNFHGDGSTGIPSLPKLKELNLSGGIFTTLNFLKNQPSLEKFDFSAGRCENSFPLLLKLKALNFSNNKYTSRDSMYRTLTSVPNLNEINLSDNDFNNIDFLYTTYKDERPSSLLLTIDPVLPDLKKLDLSYNQITYADKLYLHKKLQELNLSNNKLSKIPEVGAIYSLKKLNLASNLFNDIAGLAPLKDLEELDLSDNRLISDLSAIKSLTGLRVLKLNQTGFNDMSILSGMKLLKYLDVDNTTLTNLFGIENLKSLEELKAQTIKNTEIEKLAKLKNLKVIRVNFLLPDIKEKLEKEIKGVKIYVGQVLETRDTAWRETETRESYE